MNKKLLLAGIIIINIVLLGCKHEDQPLQPDKPETENPETPAPDSPKPERDGYRVYAYNNTGWSNLYLYMWGEKNDLNGKWPGMSPSGSIMINGYEFLYFDMGEKNTGLKENLIFNCIDKQLNEACYTISKDIYYEVTSNYVAVVDPKTFSPSPNGSISDGNAVTDMVVYEANPRFFATNDCLNALTDNLDRIKKLGCDVIWIMPVCETSTASQSIGSPYCIKNYEVINPKYGTIVDFQNLVKSAHNKGLKIVLDWVPNHTGWDNPWVKEHPDWFLRNDKGEILSPPGMGWNDVAQLNYENPEVAIAMSNVIKYWVNITDIDGIRFDYADSPYITSSFWTSIVKDLRSLKTDFILLAESSNYVFYNYGFDMIYDWDSAPTISKGFLQSQASNIVIEAQNAISKVPNGDSILRYVFNHDVMSENAIDSYYGSIDALPAAYVCATMLNGTPLIYSGMDVSGLKGTQSFMNYRQLTFSEAFTPIYNAINQAFKSTFNVRKGTLTNYSTSKVVCFARTLKEQLMLVIVNTSGNNQSYNVSDELKGLEFEDLIKGTQLVLNNIDLKPYEYLILTYK